MQTIIIVTHVTVAVILVLTVLLQAGKGAGMGAAFGGSSSSVFGARGPATLISKITCAAAVIFMVTSLGLSLFQQGSHSESVVDDVPVAASPATPETPELSASPATDGAATPAEGSAN